MLIFKHGRDSVLDGSIKMDEFKNGNDEIVCKGIGSIEGLYMFNNTIVELKNDLLIKLWYTS